MDISCRIHRILFQKSLSLIFFFFRKCTLKCWMNILNYCRYLGHSMCVQYFIISLNLSELDCLLKWDISKKSRQMHLWNNNFTVDLDYIEKLIVLYPKCTTVNSFCIRLFRHTSINYAHDGLPSFLIFLILIVFN